MILPDYEIQRLANDGMIKGFRLDRLNPASYDMGLGTNFIDINSKLPFDLVENGVFTLMPNQPVLATTQEYFILPDDICGMVVLKSSAARRGLDHALAGWVDCGFSGELTLEFHAHTVQKLTVGKCYAQIIFTKMMARPKRTYAQTGRYNGQTGATVAKD